MLLRGSDGGEAGEQLPEAEIVGVEVRESAQNRYLGTGARDEVANLRVEDALLGREAVSEAAN